MSADKIFGHPSCDRAYKYLEEMNDDALTDPTQVNAVAKVLRSLGLSQSKISNAIKRERLMREVKAFDGDPKIKSILTLLESLI